MRAPVNSASVFTNLYVKELAPSTTEEQFLALFASFGTITSHKLFPNDGKPFGFVNFEKHEDAVRAVEEMHGKKIEDNELYVARAMSKTERKQFLAERHKANIEKTKDCNLFVKNLSPKVDEQMLRSVFGRYGEITSPKVMRDQEGNSRGFGFVCFAKKEGAQEALKNVKQVDGKDVEVFIAQSKGERRIMLQHQHQRRMFPMGPGFRAGFPMPQNNFAPHMHHPMNYGKGPDRGFAPPFAGQPPRRPAPEQVPTTTNQ